MDLNQRRRERSLPDVYVLLNELRSMSVREREKKKKEPQKIKKGRYDMDGVNEETEGRKRVRAGLKEGRKVAL